MTSFNEKINSRKKFVLRDIDSKYFIERIGSIERLKLEFGYISHFLESSYCLVIQYKDTYRVQKMAGRCFMWSCALNIKGGCNVRNLCLDRDGNEDLDNFGDPRFEYISGAVLILDKNVYAYGDTWFETVDLKKNYVTCCAYICGRMVSKFRIPAKVFDRIFGLKENFPKQYEKIFGKIEEVKPVKEEKDLIEEAKRNVELYIDSLYSTRQKVEQAAGLIQESLNDIEKRKRDLNIILSELNNTFYKLRL